MKIKKIKVQAMPPTKRRFLTNDEYQFVFSRAPRICLDFIIVKDRTILMTKRTIEPFKGFWHIPGGMIRYKEKIDAAAERILCAELGCRPLGIKLVGFIEYLNAGPYLHSISMVFLTVLAPGKLRGSAQAHKIFFFPSVPKPIPSAQAAFLKQNWTSLVKHKIY